MIDTLVTFLLDRSGSMQSCKESTIEAFNAYLAGLKAEPDVAINFTLLQFDTEGFDKLCVSTPVGNVADLTSATFVPRGGTPLLDAAFKTIKAVEEAVAREKQTSKIVVCIQTDGEENSSTEHTWEELKTLIERRTAEGWQFNFMGAGIDAYVQGAKMGIAAMATVSYDSTSPKSTRQSFAAAALNTASFSAGRSKNTNFTSAQRRASGDRFRPDLGSGLTSRTAPLVLTTPTSASAPVRRRQTVPDVTL